jgi:hypothetical protein
LESWDILFGPRHSRRRSFIRSTQVGTLRDHRDRFDRSVGVVNAIDKAGAKFTDPSKIGLKKDLSLRWP